MQWRQSHRIQRNYTCTEQQEKRKAFLQSGSFWCQFLFFSTMPFHLPTLNLSTTEAKNQQLPTSPLEPFQYPAVCNLWEHNYPTSGSFHPLGGWAHWLMLFFFLSLLYFLFPAVIYSGSGMIQLTSTVSITQNGENPELSLEQYIRKNKKPY